MMAAGDGDVTAQTPEQPAAARAPAPYRHNEWRPAGESFKSIPGTKEQRELIRQHAAAAAARLPRRRPPDKQALRAAAEALLKPLGYDHGYVGFTMVLLNNEYWREQFATVPADKRLLLLPQCLRQAGQCPARIDETQLHCQQCGLCSIADLSAKAKHMGYSVLIAEGTPSVLRLITSGQVDAIFGVACLNVLEKAFDKVLQVGLPALAVPLLRDTCHNTAVDEDWVLEVLQYQRPVNEQTGMTALQSQAGMSGPQTPRSFVPLLREVAHYFDPPTLAELIPAEHADAPRADKAAETERMALLWLRQGGKRFRPFVTVAAWQALTDQDDAPLHVKRVAAAMEVFHKASLIHDDIEDGDDFRYGAAALHKTHSVPVALNIGDYLIGRGYRLVADELPRLGPDRVARIMQRLTHAHMKLCEGQGAELLWRAGRDKELPPLECLRLYALKTAPAFGAALHAGLILGGGNGEWDNEIAEFTKHLGVAYQIQNDLKEIAVSSPECLCGDIIKSRPTVLLAMALEVASPDEKADLLAATAGTTVLPVPLARLREIYYTREIPRQAAQLADRQRARALETVAHVRHDGLRALFTFLAATLLD